MIEENIVKQPVDQPLKVETHLWRDVIICSIVLTILAATYFFFQRGSITLGIANQFLADVGMLLMGLSFALSGICYFLNVADHYIIYRKQLGVIGFFYIVVHGIFSLLFLPEYQPILFAYLKEDTIIPFLTGLTALLFFTLMALISTEKAMHMLGGRTWRRILRFGYLAYMLGLIHMYLNSYPFWIRYLSGQGRSPFPSFGLITFIFGIFVILLRIVLWIATRNKTPPTQPAATT